MALLEAHEFGESVSDHVADPSWRPLYKVGAGALFVAGAAYLMVTVTSSMIGVAPGDTMKYLNALSSHSGTATLSYVVVAVADLALIPAALALYLVLRNVSKSWMLLAAVILFIYVAVDISTFIPTALGLVTLAGKAQSQAVVGAEHFGLATVPLTQFFGWIFPTVAFLIIAVLVRIGHLGRFTALLGFLLVVFSVLGGMAFLHPVASLQRYQLPGLALEGFFSFALALMLIRLDHDPS